MHSFSHLAAWQSVSFAADPEERGVVLKRCRSIPVVMVIGACSDPLH